MLAPMDLEQLYKQIYILSQDYNFSISEVENMPSYEIDYYNILIMQREELKRLQKLNEN